MGGALHYRKLLLPLSDTQAGLVALDIGLRLAQRWGAHLAGTIVRIDAASVAPLAGEGLSGAMIEDMMDEAEREGARRAEALQARFHDAAAQAGIRVVSLAEARAEASASITVFTGSEDDVVPSLARLADLTILPHGDEPGDAGASGFLHAVLFESGRPVLIAPREKVGTLGQRCCVAWNGTTESSAALWAMLPWLRQAQAVRVLHAAEYQRHGPRAEDALAYLKLQGVQADVAVFQAVNRDVGAGLLAAAAAFNADLVGMGAYSHSRLRQMILGGVTRHVLGRAAVPVLMAR
jgi:nucleotide-binding universal stress UspA family protein